LLLVGLVQSFVLGHLLLDLLDLRVELRSLDFQCVNLICFALRLNLELLVDLRDSFLEFAHLQHKGISHHPHLIVRDTQTSSVHVESTCLILQLLQVLGLLLVLVTIAAKTPDNEH